jgi:hypothetical protein
MVAAAPGGSEGSAVSALYATHLAILLREAAPKLDAVYTAEALLAALAPAHHLHVRHGLSWSLERMLAGWEALVDALTA